MKRSTIIIMMLLLALPTMAQKKSDLAIQIHTLDSVLKVQTNTIQSLNESIIRLTTLCSTQTAQISALTDSIRTLRLLRDSVRVLRHDLSELSRQMEARMAELSSQLAEVANVGTAPRGPMTQKDTIISFVKQFITAYNDGNKEEWLKYVLHPERIGKLEISKDDIDGISDNSSVKTFQYKSDTWYEVSGNYYVKKVDDGYKIDFEASLCYNAVTLREFTTSQYTTPKSFRVVMELTDNCNDYYFTSEKYYSFRCYDLTSNGIECFFVKKGSDVAKKLYDLTKRGGEVKVVIEAKYMRETDSYGDTKDAPVITRLVQEGWITE